MMLLSVVRCPPFLSDRTLHCEWGIRIIIDFRASLNRRVQKILTATHEKKATEHPTQIKHKIQCARHAGNRLEQSCCCFVLREAALILISRDQRAVQ